MPENASDARPSTSSGRAPATFQFLRQERVVYGRPAAEVVVEEATRAGAARVLIVASRSLINNTPVVADIRDALGSRAAAVFDGCREHTPIETVIGCADKAREVSADLIVSIGGGTVIDTVKAAILCLAENINDKNGLLENRVTLGDAGRPRVPTTAAAPVRQVAVPTTLSGAEYSNLAGVTDSGRAVKDAYISPDAVPLSVVLDAEAARYTPGELWLSTGIRSVDHAVESLCSAAPTVLTDATGLHALRLFAAALPGSADDPDARLDCLLAVWMAAFGIARVPYGASHGIGHQLGAVAGIPHGITSCVMLPSVMRYNLSETAAQQELIAEAMGGPEAAAADLVEAFVARLGLPTRLRDAGVREDQLAQIAEGSLGNMMVRSNPRPIRDAAQIMEILRMAW